MKSFMAIFNRMRRAPADGASMIMASLLAMSMLLSPVAPTAQADSRYEEKVLLKVIQNSTEPCRALSVNPNQHINAVINRTQRQLGVGWDDAIRLTSLSIIHYCSQFLGHAPAVAGVPFGPWVLIPFSSPEQPLMLAYWQGRKGCALARNQGVGEAVRVLSIPNPETQPYGGVGVNEAKLGMVVSAVMFCQDQLIPVRAFMGG